MRPLTFLSFALVALANCAPAHGRSAGGNLVVDAPRDYVAELVRPSGPLTQKGPVVQDFGERPAIIQRLVTLDWEREAMANLQTASDEANAREVSQLRQLLETWYSEGGYNLILTRTRDGQWSRVTGLEELQRKLAPIDSSERARLIAHRAGHAPFRGPGPLALRETEDGYVFVEESAAQKPLGQCSMQMDEIIEVERWTVRVEWTVFRDGTIEETDRDEVGQQRSTMECHPHPRGRAPEGFVAHSAPPHSFRFAAHYEAASVIAFQRLATELRAYGAPDELVQRAEQAASDEARHAQVMLGLAQRLEGATEARAHEARVEEGGAELDRARLAPQAGWTVRLLTAIALENAREGCVLEAYAALETLHQARYAASEQVRAELQSVAHDELAHAQLAFDLQAWLQQELTPDEREACDRLLDTTLAELDRQPPASPRDSGLPSAATARALKQELRAYIAMQQTQSARSHSNHRARSRVALA